MKRLRLPVVIPSLAACLMASPALASFHIMKIEQAMGGVDSDTSQQAIQLRMRTGGQNFLGGACRLRAWDATGANPVTLIAFTSDVANGSQGDRVLVVSSAFATAQPGISPDFTMTNTIPASYLPAGRLTFEDIAGNVYWSLAWGGAGYTGSNSGLTTNDADGNFGPPFGSALPSSGTQALRFSASDPTGAAASTSNAADYSLTAGTATFTNNAGASGTVTPNQADLSVTKTDGGREGRYGFPLAYTITATNNGPGAVSGATLSDTFPPGFGPVSWTCTASAGSSCPASGTGNIVAMLTLLNGGTATFTATGTVANGTASPLVNTATVAAPVGITDPNPVNNSATASTVLGNVQFQTATPCRVVDTRNPAGPRGGPALGANTARSFPITGACSIPAEARAVAINVTVVQPTDVGDLRLYPDGTTAPLASTVNFGGSGPGQVRANNAIIGLGASGQLAVLCDMPANSTGVVHVLIDVAGYFQ